MKKFRVKEDTVLDYGDHETIPKDKIVYEYTFCTYGCIASGVAVSDSPGADPFYEMPEDSLEMITVTI